MRPGSCACSTTHAADVWLSWQRCLKLPLPLPCFLVTVNEKRDHIPPVVSGSAVTFPFDITVAG